MSVFSHRRGVFMILLLLNAAALPAAYFLGRPRSLQAGVVPSPVPADYGAISAFRLTGSDGEVFLSERLKGSPVLMNFIFTHCPAQCPMLTQATSLLQEVLPDKVRFVSITVDPKRDKPRVLAEYAKRFKADPARWHFLTGDKRVINRILDEAHLGPAENLQAHSLRWVLLDGESRIRGFYDSADPASVKQLKKDVQELAGKK